MMPGREGEDPAVPVSVEMRSWLQGGGHQWDGVLGGLCFCSHCLPWRRARSKHKGRKSSVNAVGGFLGQDYGGERQISPHSPSRAHTDTTAAKQNGDTGLKKKEPRRDSSQQRRLMPLPLGSRPHTGNPELTGAAAPRPAQRLPPAICLPRRPGRVWAWGGAAAWRAGRCWPASGPGSGRRGRPDSGSGDGRHGGGGWGRGGWGSLGIAAAPAAD